MKPSLIAIIVAMAILHRAIPGPFYSQVRVDATGQLEQALLLAISAIIHMLTQDGGKRLSVRNMQPILVPQSWRYLQLLGQDIPQAKHDLGVDAYEPWHAYRRTQYCTSQLIRLDNKRAIAAI